MLAMLLRTLYSDAIHCLHCVAFAEIKQCPPGEVPDYATKRDCMPLVDYPSLKPKWVQAKDSAGKSIPRSIQSFKHSSSSGSNGIAVWRTPRSYALVHIREARIPVCIDCDGMAWTHAHKLHGQDVILY